MSKNCVLCGEDIFEEFGKLKGTLLKVINEKGLRELIPVCCYCQKAEGWVEGAKIKGV